MRAFEYQALDAGGKRVLGELMAESEAELDRLLEAKGLLLTGLRPAAEARRAARHRLQADELVSLSTQLSTITSAGVPLLDGLESIARRMTRASSRGLVEQLAAALRAGQSLSEAMGQHPESFSEVYRSSIQAGEASGALEHVLTRLARHLEWARGMRAIAVQALIYPCILFCALCGLVALLVCFVLPRLLKLFPSGPVQLPAPTRVLLALSDFTSQHALWLAPALALAAIALAAWARQPAARRRWHGWLLDLPRVGAVAQQIATANFAATAATLQSAGCDVFTTLSIAARSCGNAALQARFEHATQSVRAGQPISEALSPEPHVDPLLVQMVAVGEKSGRLDECLEKLVRYYDDEVPRAVKRFLAFAEPAMLLAAGGVVAFVLLAALLPIFSLYGKI